MENKTSKKMGIGLYRIQYEMDLKDKSKDASYDGGILAYSSEEAVNRLVDFCRKQVKGFKGVKINQVSFEGGCHAISDSVRNAIIDGAVKDGLVVFKEDHKVVEAELKKAKTTKKSIIPKNKE